MKKFGWAFLGCGGITVYTASTSASIDLGEKVTLRYVDGACVSL